MTELTQQRIVGGGVILAVLAIFLPILLHPSKPIPRVNVAMRIPAPQSEHEELHLQLPAKQSTSTAPSKSVAPTIALTDPALPLKPKATPAPTMKKSLNATSGSASHRRAGWVLQLATFSNSKNADNLVARLHRQGIVAYTRRSQQAKLTRVFVGPARHHRDAVFMQHRLAKAFHLNGVIRRRSRV